MLEITKITHPKQKDILSLPSQANIRYSSVKNVIILPSMPLKKENKCLIRHNIQKDYWLDGIRSPKAH